MNPSSLTFSKILSGAYKTLNVANQIIPLYRQVSPMIKNARNTFTLLKEFRKPTYNSVKVEKVVEQKKEQVNNPVFFQ